MNGVTEGTARVLNTSNMAIFADSTAVIFINFFQQNLNIPNFQQRNPDITKRAAIHETLEASCRVDVPQIF